MGRRAAKATHLGLALLGTALYVLFVIPRWWVLTGDFPATLGTVGRIAAGFPIAAAAMPVMLTLQQSLKAEVKAPELALRLRAWSAVLHLVAGALLIVTAVVEIWVTLDVAGPWLFAVYGAAGSVAVLGIAAFALSFVAEKPPAPPKPPKEKKARKGAAEEGAADTDTDTDADTDADSGSGAPTSAPKTAKKNKTPRRRRLGRKRPAAGAADVAEATDDDAEDSGTAADETITEKEGAAADETVADSAADVEGSVEDVVSADLQADAEPGPAGGLRNLRPTGKRRHRLRR